MTTPMLCLCAFSSTMARERMRVPLEIFGDRIT